MCDVHTDMYVEVRCVMYIQTLCVFVCGALEVRCVVYIQTLCMCVCGGEMCDVHTDIMYVWIEV